MANTPIYTIGHGNRSLEQFVALLKRYQIAYVVDVRSQPYSRHSPHFSKSALEQSLKAQGLHYIFMGDVLGGRPQDTSCYDSNGRVDYAIVRGKHFYQAGIERLRMAWQKQLRVAVMCSEAKPEACHRSKLISTSLVEQGIAVVHIDEVGNVKRQQDIQQGITGGQPTLFEAFDSSASMLNPKMGLSRKKYKSSSGRDSNGTEA
jgi:uncharacterized protein (DUF488 family)